ncbi:MAG: LPS export ABC transporter permease LptG [Alphaproteobacteria bacterium CG11_big_fil_rev_8_21_14_0_20_44_7]|nr:MAG: LPS export ABC transporter permease LptG [Alphaproteobacteria bacterium CG11_big_fil_rev_8_21_14_0_20_44_7]
MKTPTILSFYFARHFMLWLLIGFVTCSLLVLLIDLVELLRKAANIDVSFFLILKLAFLRLPSLVQLIAPFAFLFGAILCYIRLTKTQELVIARASGISVWQFLFPSLFASFIIGILIVTVFNPVAAAMNSKASRTIDRYFENKISQITVSESGLWLKQYDEKADEDTIITAASISTDNMIFKDVTIFEFDNANHFKRRIDARTGVLKEGYWVFSDVITNMPASPPEKFDNYSIRTNLSLAQIQDSFNSPDTISFWELPSFIKTLERSGFSALRHKLHFHTILATPILLVAMVMIAAIFSIRYSRKGRTGLLISGAMFTGFLFFFSTRITASFGIAGNMPIILAAWTPAIISILIGLWFLLHLEDG